MPRSTAGLAVAAVVLFGAGVGAGLLWSVDGSRPASPLRDRSPEGSVTSGTDGTREGPGSPGTGGTGGTVAAAPRDGTGATARGGAPAGAGGDAAGDPDGTAPGSGSKGAGPGPGTGGASGTALDDAARALDESTAPASAASSTVGRAEPPGPWEAPEVVEGRIFDASTREPIPGARVSLQWQLDDGTVSSSMGIDVMEDGSFSFRPAELKRNLTNQLRQMEVQGQVTTVSPDGAPSIHRVNFRLQGEADGYVSVSRGDPPAHVDLALSRDASLQGLGSLRVDARWPDDVPVSGRILLRMSSKDRDPLARWALPGPDGTYLLDGIPSGRWRVAVSGRHDSGTPVEIRPGEETAVRLPAPRRGIEEPKNAPSGPPRTVEVAVGPHPVLPGTFIAAVAPKAIGAPFWLSPVTGAGARFQALPAGPWEFVLRTGTTEIARFPATVEEGAGTAYLEFPE